MEKAAHVIPQHVFCSCIYLLGVNCVIRMYSTRLYKCYAQLVFPKRGMCLVFPKRGRYYRRMLQMLRTSVKCLWSAGVLGYWIVAGVLGYWLFAGVIGYWQVLCIIVEQLCLVCNCLSPKPETTSLSNWKSDRLNL